MPLIVTVSFVAILVTGPLIGGIGSGTAMLDASGGVGGGSCATSAASIATGAAPASIAVGIGFATPASTVATRFGGCGGGGCLGVQATSNPTITARIRSR